METKINRISDFECEVEDPQTGGMWKVVSDFPMTDLCVLDSLVQTLYSSDSRPAKGVVHTIRRTLPR